MDTRPVLIFLGGMNVNCDPKAGWRSITSSLTRHLVRLCKKQGWEFAFVPGWERLQSVDDGLRKTWEICRYYHGRPMIMMTSSFGGWIALKVLLETQRQEVCFPTLKSIILFDPFFSVEGYQAKLPSRLVKMARKVGYPRPALKFWKSFWVPAGMVNSLLDPREQVLRRELMHVAANGPEIVLLEKEKSVFKTDADRQRLLNLLQLTPTPVTDAILYLREHMRQLVN